MNGNDIASGAASQIGAILVITFALGFFCGAFAGMVLL